MLRHSPLSLRLLMLFALLCESDQVSALKLTDFFEFQQRLSTSPAKNMLVTQSGIPPAPCEDNLPEGPLDLVELVEQGLCNSPKTSQMWATVRAQSARVGVERANYLPRVNLISSISKLHNIVTNSGTPILDQNNHILSREYSLRLTWLLADFGQRSAKVNQAEALLDAANALQDATLQEVFIEVAQAYFDNLSAQTTLIAYEESESVAKESLAAATAKFKAGVGLLTDQLQAQTAYAQAKLDRIKAEGEVKNAHGTLATAIGIVANTRFTIQLLGKNLEQTDFVTTVDDMIQQAINSHPLIKSAKAKLHAAKENINAIKAEGLPTLSMNAEVNRIDQLGQQQIVLFDPSNVYSKNSSIGVQINIPLFEGFARSYQVQSAEADSLVRVAELNKIIQQVTLDVWKSYNALISERENLRATEELFSNSLEAFEIAQGRYNAGVGNITELLSAQSALSNARQQNIKSLAMWRAARLKLASSMGTAGLWAITKSNYVPE